MSSFDLDRLRNEVNKFAKYNNIQPVIETKQIQDKVSIIEPEVKTPVFTSVDPDLVIEEPSYKKNKLPSLKRMGIIAGISFILTVIALITSNGMFTVTKKIKGEKEGEKDSEIITYSYILVGLFFIIVAFAVSFLLNKFVNIYSISL